MIAIALAFLLNGEFPEDEIASLRDLRRAIREKRVEASALRKSAHEELDRANYELAVEKHRKASALEKERESMGADERDRVEKICAGLVKDLDHDSFETRERASKVLARLGPSAVPVLERLAPGPSAEVRYRLADAIARLKTLEVDADGRLRQWASSARASSEYSNSDWSAAQATGKPDTAAAGDARTAWASLEADAGEEWLELGYGVAVVPTRVRIHETFNPGAVVRVDALDDQGAWRTLWQGRDRTSEGIRWFEVAVAPGFATRAIRITLDTSSVPGWNEIDAVELIGDPDP